MSKEAADALNLSEEVQRLSKGLQGAFDVGDDGVITCPKETFKELLPPDISPEMLKRVQQFEGDFYAASVDAVSATALPFLKKHKDVGVVRADKIHLGKNTIRMQTERQAEVTSPRTGPVTKYLWTSGKLTTAAGSNSAAVVGRVRTHYAELGAAEFGGK